MEWISVKDKLPEYQKECLVCYKYITLEKKYVGISFLHKTDKKGNHWKSYGIENFIITHWMPLPEPPM